MDFIERNSWLTTHAARCSYWQVHRRNLRKTTFYADGHPWVISPWSITVRKKKVFQLLLPRSDRSCIRAKILQGKISLFKREILLPCIVTVLLLLTVLQHESILNTPCFLARFFSLFYPLVRDRILILRELPNKILIYSER
jgi:hypothetical protein